MLGINNDIIADIESFANENRNVLENTSYNGINTFKFRPGHKLFLLELPKHIEAMRKAKTNKDLSSGINDFSYILKTFMETAEANMGKSVNAFRYNDTNRYFSIYIYLMCGKSCYETLSANLPIPKSSTICKHVVTFQKY